MINVFDREARLTFQVNDSFLNDVPPSADLTETLEMDGLDRFEARKRIVADLDALGLIEKTEERKVDVPTDYVGFKTTSKFLVGYGLGYQEKYRNLPSVAALAN